MATPVKLPALGESVTEGTVTRWLKQPGDSVEVDEPLLEVSTDKVDTEIPSPVAGTLLEIKVDEDETVEVGAELAVVGDSDESSGGGDESSDQESSDQEASSDDSAAQATDESEDAPGEEEPDDEGDGSSDEPAAETTEKSEDSSGGGDGTKVLLPELGESVTEGTVTRWLKQVGDSVEVDEPLLEVSTDKVDTEIPSPVAGKLLEIKVDEDETVQVGAELAVVGDSSAQAQEEPEDKDEPEEEPEEEPADKPEEPEEPADQPEEPADKPEEPADKPEESDEPEREEAERKEPEPAEERPSHAAEEPSAAKDGTSYVTPLVRKLAAQHDVDLSGLTGTGVGGRIRKQDVLAAAEQKPAEAPAADAQPEQKPEVSPLRGTTEKLSRLRKVIAARMIESLQTSAQLTTVVEVDVTAIARLRVRAKEQFTAREGVKLSFLPFFAKAAIDGLKTYPQLNASIDTDKGEVTYHDNEHLGIAVDTERGLLVPVIKDAGDLSIAGLARKITDIATRTRDNKIGPDELAGGTFTLTNTGSRGALFDTPIINQPQVAILGTGTVVKRPVVIDDPNLGETIAVRQMVYLALTYDHRLVDGADAARFLGSVKERLEEGQFESELGI
ncbi:MAG: 2-oxoglutarate dehydrogenase, E2 component, dihydrolipoamide succinyltransferase [Actinomycetota bacterium]|nr:2-oxoglutarate dehydrogenase, E2 component, dihydrolipoamide succinyltransferase [Actinomycetota bacterium]